MRAIHLPTGLAILLLSGSLCAQPQPKAPAALFGTAAAADRNSRVGYPQDVPLKDAVADFNARAHADPVGASQSPLTADEIVAAIRACADPPVKMPAAIKAVYQSIAQKGVMPKGSFIRVIPGLIAVNGFDVDVWWVDVQVALDKYPTDLADVPSTHTRCGLLT